MSYRIFEPRYIKMLESVLEGEKLITLALLKLGHEEDDYGNPDYYPMGVLGKILEYESLPNGEYSIIVEGLMRVGIGKLIKDFPYCVAEVEPIPEFDADQFYESEKREILLRLSYLAEYSIKGNAFTNILSNQESIALLVNIIAKTIPMKPNDKYNLLAMDSIKQRADKVLWFLDDQIETLELLKNVDLPIKNNQMMN
jgi:ATP-dependent Lon protease